jgi:hypothetical protein
LSRNSKRFYHVWWVATQPLACCADELLALR